MTTDMTGTSEPGTTTTATTATDGPPGAAAGCGAFADAEAPERAALVARALTAVGRPVDDDPTLARLVERYYRHVALEDLRERTDLDLLGAVLSQRRLAERRAPGTAAVRVFTPTVDEHGWTCGHTVVEIVAEDVPFLVDSVSAELARAGRGIHLVNHPQVTVRRDPTGALLQVVLPDTPTDAAGAPTPALPADPGLHRESWIHVEIDRDTDPGSWQDLDRRLRAVLDDVRVTAEDWPKMRRRALDVAEDLLRSRPAGVADQDVEDATELLGWLADNHFTFLGYREYRLEERDGHDELTAVTGTGLGILRHDQKVVPGAHRRLTVQARSKAREPRLLVLTKANSRATVHRNAYLDYIGVKVFDAEGRVTGERRFLGLFSSSAYTDSVLRIPVVSRTVGEVVRLSGFGPGSHSAKDLVQFLETYPRDELFEISPPHLLRTALAVLHLQERRRTRLFMRADDYGRYASCLVYLPRDRYTTTVRLRIEDILREAYGAVHVDYTARVTESVLARLHFVVRVPAGTPLPVLDPLELEQRLVEATRAWDDDLAEALRADVGEEEGARLMRRWGRAFPQGYRETYSARTGVADLRRLEELAARGGDPADALAMNLYEPVGAGPGHRRFKLYRLAPLSLTSVLPYLAHLGVEVVDERPYELVREADGAEPALRCFVYDFGLHAGPAAVAATTAPGTGAPAGAAASAVTGPARASARDLFCDAFTAAWSGRADSDGFDRLVLTAGLTWRQVVVLRLYAKYLRQAGSKYSQAYIERTLEAHVGITAQLVHLFEVRFDPDHPLAGEADAGRAEAAAAVVGRVRAGLDEVASLDHDRILRAYLGCITATLRTNFYQRAADGGPKDYVSIKLDPHAVPELPAPRPAFEIFVYSPRVEGVHLRFGSIARGGLRWSDRREDFRTEVLGLVKAQMVKNAVIVPTGAKGGFVAKHLPDPGVDREAWLAEGVACYRTFVRGLLDLTDNLVARPDGTSATVPPPRVVRHDGDDPYLVVAADKGTATFSDIANAVAAEYGFWLGDAFASGGSVGYDHKAMGITARGAWESVRRHFRELGVDVQGQPVTVVGIGDMSGDVFGNGMLLSDQLRLVAAFDHRHVFLDPDPDPAVSFAERRRLFALPRSSWDDYDRRLLSPGGGVHPRSAKSVTVTPQVAARLGLQEGVQLTPQELIQAVLRAPVDLLWNGGIGTYVKAASETHAQVGDKANDAIRVDGRDLRVRVVGEGGNLGATQLGRVEAARRGVLVNTDAIDNSAGVDCSDHEVNIKILLDQVVAAGDLTLKQRTELLAAMTDDVAALVLRDNYAQNVLLGNARHQAKGMLGVQTRFMRQLEHRGLLDRALEFLPDDAEVARRQEDGEGLTSPEFAVLSAYAKIAVAADIAASDLPDDPWLDGTLRAYFPPLLVERFGDRLAGHRLRREIIVNALTNEMVNHGGITFAFRAFEETGASAEHVARAYAVCREVFDLPGFVAQVEALDGVLTTSAQTALHLHYRRLLDRAVRWFVQYRPGRLDVAAEVARFRPVVADLGGQLPDLLVGSERSRLAKDVARFTALGVPAPLAQLGGSLLTQYMLLDITMIAETTGRAPADVARLHLTLSERFAVDALLVQISGLGRGDRWQSLARASLRGDLYSVLEDLTESVLEHTGDDDASPEDAIVRWERENSAGVARARQTLQEILFLEKIDLASISVALRTLRGLIRSRG